MYTQSDIEAIKKQGRQRVLAWLVPEALLTGLVIFSFVRRVQWLTVLLFALLGCLVLFSLALYILPVNRYKKHLERAVYGRQRRSVLAFKSAESKIVQREGVAFHPLLFSAGQFQDAMDDRLLYWDANLSPPSWQPGDRLVIHSHEKAIVSHASADATEALSG
mgnify:FL=1